jgi:hypothetical protein
MVAVGITRSVRHGVIVRSGGEMRIAVNVICAMQHRAIRVTNIGGRLNVGVTSGVGKHPMTMCVIDSRIKWYIIEGI